ncbi:sigma-54 interaction domain-containing protein [Candidatus Nitrosacidococcus tergens]|uniref:Sigma-54 factor interaction domain-containing protein n=1 Tax=Candidatus Nitrosacidococcus tergens TaxID=553981 RepID=A0A7G1Q8H9_9GAMM|nr:sigma-54 dependent transcriptional regulator [Candidatus Nitrosacidococcus tergens]CAB1275041.1 Sigma-54 factor interaction domain-containing protein [Candidatus Nitrosacidococcus tergens]
MNGFEALIGSAPAFEALIRSTQMVAATDVTALITGETGTGKELMAQAIHVESHRSDRVFTPINCAALPEDLAESELFGHRRGAFSGATHDHLGRLRASEGGTVFLDEVNELSPAIQAKLLRFLESGECQSVGETYTHHCNVRIIAATNCDLHQWVEERRFRRDLYYRLHVVPLSIPPLRERKEDIPLLLEHFSSTFSQQYKLASPQFSKAALSILNSYYWPGNIRELRNLCERIVVLLPGKMIEPQNLPFEIQGKDFSVTTTEAPIITLPENGLALDQVEIELIHQAITRAQGNRSKAARLLGISRDTLCYRMQKHAIDT